jgi:hypothetical protein
LKKDSLLAKYTPKAEGIPAKVGSYPIHDPEGFYAGFAASGYGIILGSAQRRASGFREEHPGC